MPPLLIFAATKNASSSTRCSANHAEIHNKVRGSPNDPKPISLNLSSLQKAFSLAGSRRDLLFVVRLGADVHRETQRRVHLAAINCNSKTIEQDGTAVRPLEVGNPIESVLRGAEVHSYEVTTLTDNQYFLMVVDQHGIDVVVSVLQPDGKKLSEVNYTKAAMEWLPFVAERAGRYRIDVRAAEKDAASGRYEAKLAALRIPTAEDRGMVEALRLIQQARGLAAEGKLDEALPLAETALKLRENALGPDHFQVAQALSLVARILDYKGEPTRSDPLYRRALVIAERELGPDHFDLSVMLNDYANLLQGRAILPPRSKCTVAHWLSERRYSALMTLLWPYWSTTWPAFTRRRVIMRSPNSGTNALYPSARRILGPII